jgi:hypothetical protein
MSSSIGGLDLVLETSRQAFDPRLILDVVLDRWPEGVFQNADEETTRSLEAVAAGEDELTSAEFLLYQDEASAQNWALEGRTTANGNQLLHFLIQDEPTSGLVRVTLVIDELTPEMAGLYHSLSAALPPAGRAGTVARPLRTPLPAALQAAGCRLSRADFYDRVDDVRKLLYPGWTPDELACHPHDALQFCSAVRQNVNAPVPDSVIMKAMFNQRKRKQTS